MDAVALDDELIKKFKPSLVFKNYQKEINSIDLSRCGRFLVTGSDDNCVNYYDVEKGEKINTYYCKRYGVDLVRFTHHHKTILCASKRENFHRVLYWSLHDNVILCSFLGHTDVITALDLNPLTSTFVSCSKNGEARVWDYERKASVLLVRSASAAAFDNTGNVLACLFT